MNEPTNRAKMIGAAKRSLLNSGIEYWCERDDLPLDAAIDAISAAQAAADHETWIEAINKAFWKNPEAFRKDFTNRSAAMLEDQIDSEYEWVLIAALDELPTGIKGETAARDTGERRRDLREDDRIAQAIGLGL